MQLECFHVIAHVLSWQHLILQLNISHVASCTTISLFFLIILIFAKDKCNDDAPESEASVYGHLSA